MPALQRRHCCAAIPCYRACRFLEHIVGVEDGVRAVARHSRGGAFLYPTASSFPLAYRRLLVWSLVVTPVVGGVLMLLVVLRLMLLFCSVFLFCFFVLFFLFCFLCFFFSWLVFRWLLTVFFLVPIVVIMLIFARPNVAALSNYS